MHSHAVHDACRVLIITESLPMPDMQGCDRRLMQVVQALLSLGCQVRLLVGFSQVDGAGEMDDQAERVAAMLARVQQLEEIGVLVSHYDPASSGQQQEARGARAQAPVPPSPLERIVRGLALKDGRIVVRGWRPTAVVLCLWFWRGPTAPTLADMFRDDIHRLAPGAKRVVLTDDVHARREASLAQIIATAGLGAAIAVADEGGASDLASIAAAELRAYSSADVVATITAHDAGVLEPQLARFGKRLKLTVWPMAVTGCPDYAAALVDRAAFDARPPCALFVGSLDSLANRAALAWLLVHVWPGVRAQVPHALLLLVGSDANDRWNAMRASLGATVTSGVLHEGFVNSVRLAELYMMATRVLLSPGLADSGVVTKAVEALQFALPVVSLRQGAHGLEDCQLALASNASEFVRATVQLLTDGRAWEHQSRAGLASVVRALAPGHLRKAVAGVVWAH